LLQFRKLRIVFHDARKMRAGHRHVGRRGGIAVPAPRLRRIEERFFNEQKTLCLRQTATELLRALPDKAPAQMAEDNDAGICRVFFDTSTAVRGGDCVEEGCRPPSLHQPRRPRVDRRWSRLQQRWSSFPFPL